MPRRSPPTRMAGSRCDTVDELSTARRTGLGTRFGGGPAPRTRRSISSSWLVRPKSSLVLASATAASQAPAGSAARARRRVCQSSGGGSHVSVFIGIGISAGAQSETSVATGQHKVITADFCCSCPGVPSGQGDAPACCGRRHDTGSGSPHTRCGHDLGTIHISWRPAWPATRTRACKRPREIAAANHRRTRPPAATQASPTASAKVAALRHPHTETAVVANP